MSAVVREQRYLVFKYTDLQDAFKSSVLTEAAKQKIIDALEILDTVLPERQCVVVESDWPEYEQVWKMIEERRNERN